METSESMSLATNIRAQLRRDEGDRERPYRDSVGVLTIGVGHNLERGLSQAIRDAIFEEDLAEARRVCGRLIPRWLALSEPRQGAFLNMAFNLGEDRLSKFKRMLEAVARDDWDRVAEEMLASHWAQQVGDRAIRLARQMRNDTWE
jgi:lysozyme